MWTRAVFDNEESASAARGVSTPPPKGMQQTALRAAADVERSADTL